MRFHPTLAIASADAALAGAPAIREPIVMVYAQVCLMLDKMLTSSQPRAALEILRREEANYRTAVRWAMEDNRLTSGDPEGAVRQLQQLIERLRQTTEFDPAFQLATTTLTLGRVLHYAGASEQAIPFLREAIAHWERLVEQVAGVKWPALVRVQPLGCSSDTEREGVESEREDTEDTLKRGLQLGNLSATLGDLANALRASGRHDEALAVAGQALAIDQARGNDREVAAAEWAAKRDAMLAELQRRAGGDRLPAQFLQACEALMLACARAGFGDSTLGAQEDEALATLAQYPAPIPDFASFLRQLADGALEPIPNSLPPELRQIVEPLANAIRGHLARE